MLIKTQLEKIMMIVCLASSGIVLLFFGYVERYPLAVAAILLYCFSAIADLRNDRTSPRTFLFLILAIALHLGSAVLVPSLIFIVLRKKTWTSRTLLALIFVTAICLLAAGHFGYFASSVLVPLVAQSQHPYSLLSMQHILDIMSVLLLVLPLFLVTLILPRSLPEIEKQFHLLAIVQGFYSCSLSIADSVL